MFKNHLKITWRNLKTSKTFSVINILGLSLGLAITILLFLFITHERSFDTMYSQKDSIYRVLLNTEENNEKEVWCSAPAALAPALKNDIPEIKQTARMLLHDFGETAFIHTNDANFTEEKLYWCDNALFKIFDIPFVKGQPENALSRPNTVVLSKSTAQKYFGTKDPLGKTIVINNKTSLEVTGVFNDFPSNSTLDCNAIASFNTTYFFKKPSWDNASFETYCLLNKNTDTHTIENKIQAVLDKNVSKKDQWYSFSLQPLRRVHLYSASYLDTYSSRKGDIHEIRNLSFLAILILLIACINYMNLITARSQKRTKDVGINKTLGATTKNLIIRFYAETGFITLIALLIGIIVAFFALPVFNTITQQAINPKLILNLAVIPKLIVIWLLTTLLAGSYPAFYLSRFSPNAILNPSFKRSKSILFIRKGLVVIQFAASVLLIIGVLVIYRQLQFVQHKKLGYNPKGVVAISIPAIHNKNKLDALVQEYKALSTISEVALAQGFPGMDVSLRSLYKNDNDQHGADIQTNHVEGNIAEVLQLKLLAGKMLPPKKAEKDSLINVVLNKKAVDYLGLKPQEAVGKVIDMGWTATVVGVVDNFNFASLREPIGPYAFNDGGAESSSFLLVRYNNLKQKNIVNQLRETFKKVVPNTVFNYVFLNKKLEHFYGNEQKAIRIGIIFCGLAIFVASLGLFGLAAFTAEQRTKEIGVRKILGASILGITSMLSKDFLNLIFIALGIAFPLAFWIMENWLEGFAYRIHISWKIFLLAGSIAVFIAMITISFQAIKAALVNPVKSLRTE